MFNRIFKNWKTSLLGLLFLGVGFALVAMGKATLAEFGAFIATSFALFYSKDPKIGSDHL